MGVKGRLDNCVRVLASSFAFRPAALRLPLSIRSIIRLIVLMVTPTSARGLTPHVLRSGIHLRQTQPILTQGRSRTDVSDRQTYIM